VVFLLYKNGRVIILLLCLMMRCYPDIGEGSYAYEVMH